MPAVSQQGAGNAGDEIYGEADGARGGGQRGQTTGSGAEAVRLARDAATEWKLLTTLASVPGRSTAATS